LVEISEELRAFLFLPSLPRETPMTITVQIQGKTIDSMEVADGATIAEIVDQVRRKYGPGRVVLGRHNSIANVTRR